MNAKVEKLKTVCCTLNWTQTIGLLWFCQIITNELIQLGIEAESPESDQNRKSKKVSKMIKIKPSFHWIRVANLSISHYSTHFFFSKEQYELAPFPKKKEK